MFKCVRGMIFLQVVTHLSSFEMTGHIYFMSLFPLGDVPLEQKMLMLGVEFIDDLCSAVVSFPTARNVLSAISPNTSLS